MNFPQENMGNHFKMLVWIVVFSTVKQQKFKSLKGLYETKKPRIESEVKSYPLEQEIFTGHLSKLTNI